MSNLIEQLGGYETAKQIVDNAPIDYIGYRSLAYSKSHGYALTHPFELISGEFYLKDIKAAMLEHRRANKIYEAGDKVVMKSKRRAPKIWTWAHTTNWRPNHSLLDCGENSLYPFSNDAFQHATDEEIAAGHRL